MAHRNPKTGKSLGDSGLFVLIEWSPKNKLSPYDYCKSSRETVEWVCKECGWEWAASINNRTAKKNPTGCPACGGRTPKPQNGKSFADLHPDLIKEWSDKNNCSPWEVYPNEAKPERWWVCPICNTEYLMNCNHRSCGQSCNNKECVSKKISISKEKVPPEKSLGYIYPDSIKYWSSKNVESPFEVFSSSSTKKYWWVCTECGNDFRRTGLDRRRSSICTKCRSTHNRDRKSTPAKEKSLATLFPDIAATWSPSNTKKPSEVYSKGHSSKYLWICTECGSEFERICADRHRSGLCEDCGRESAGKKHSTPKPFHSFGDLFPKLLKEYSTDNVRNPYSLKPGSDYLSQWICSKGHEWETRLCYRTGQNSTGCPTCCNNQTSTAEELLRESLIPFGSLPEAQKLGNWKVDIYIPESRIIIEYDGSRWHSFPGAYERDRRKSFELLAEGYKVIRVRTHSGNNVLGTLNIEHRGYFEVFCEEPKDSVPSEDLVNNIKEVLNEA